MLNRICQGPLNFGLDHQENDEKCQTGHQALALIFSPATTVVRGIILQEVSVLGDVLLYLSKDIYQKETQLKRFE